MNNNKPDFWKDYPQIIGTWPNLALLLTSTYTYYRCGEGNSIKVVLFALLVIIVLYVVSFSIRYYRYLREKKHERINDLDLHQDFHVLSVVNDRCDNNEESHCFITRTIESKVSELKFIRYRYSIFGQKSDPIVTSSTHNITYELLTTDSKGWDVILIIFKKPLRIGEIAKFSIEMNGTNCKDFQFCRVNTPIKQLVFDIKLLDKQSAPHAELIMIPIDGQTVNVVEKKEMVRFNKKERRYYIKILNPQCGYTYQLIWGEEIKKKKSLSK